MGKASTKAQNKYISKVYDRINLTVEKGYKEVIKVHAELFDGGSVNGFINRAIKEAMERDIASAGATAPKEASTDKIKAAIDQLLANEAAAEE